MQNAQTHTFVAAKNGFLLDGKPFQILSGEMHYPRIPRQYWCGWFDQWGSKQSGTSVEQPTSDLVWMLDKGYPVNFYMFRGGTNPGFMAGAN